MNDQDDNLNAPPPPEHPEPAKAAEELLSHGLLTFLHRDPPAETERRMKSVMRRIADEATQHNGGNRRLHFPHARRWIALAACFVIAAGLVYLGLPAESTAQAMVRASAQSLRDAGDSRFEIRVQPRGSKELLANPVGTIDSRGADLMVMRLQPEEGVWVTFGRDPHGPWLVRPDGHLERNPPATSLPQWGSVNDEPVAPDSVDRLLEGLAANYTLERATENDSAGNPSADHITGLRRADAKGPGAPRVDLWLDVKTHAVKRVELLFPDGPRGGGGGGGGPRGRGGAGPDGMRGPRPPHDGAGPDDHGPPGERDDGGMERDDKGPRDFNRPPPLDGPDGRRPGEGEGRGPGGPGGPMGRGFRGAPMRIELRPAPPPPFAPDWFTPEAHANKAV